MFAMDVNQEVVAESKDGPIMQEKLMIRIKNL